MWQNLRAPYVKTEIYVMLFEQYKIWIIFTFPLQYYQYCILLLATYIAQQCIGNSLLRFDGNGKQSKVQEYYILL